MTSVTSVLDSKNIPQPESVREAFQQFVAGTFFRQMFQALRKLEGENPYFHGGNVETLFRGQLDEQLVDSFAKNHGSAMVENLWQVFENRLGVEGKVYTAADAVTDGANSVPGHLAK